MRSPRAALGRRLHRWVWECPDDETFVDRFALANRQWRLPMSLTYDATASLFVVHSDGHAVAVARRSRLEYYFGGILAREATLVREYFLDDIPLAPGDIVIDVGANIGEVSRILARRAAVVPLAFEPSEPEFRALKVNLAGTEGHRWNDVLWSSEEPVEFHDANDTGDSSVFAPPGAVGSTRRQATTLDAALAQTSFCDRPIQFLKLEAEGAEPEILEGATATLQRVEHIVADVGPERGIARASTLVPVYELLRAKGFTAQQVAFKRPVMLFSR